MEESRLVPLAGLANKQGRLAADNMLARPSPFGGVVGTNILRVFDLSVASAGANERTLRARGVPYEKSYIHPASHAGYWLEVFLLGGMTAIPAEVDKIGKLVERIRPDRVQLNTVTRPPAETFALPVPKKDMERFAGRLGAPAEVIADFRGVHRKSEFAARREDVLNLLRRRPCTTEDIVAGLDMHANEAPKYVGELLERGDIAAETRDCRTYYKVL